MSTSLSQVHSTAQRLANSPTLTEVLGFVPPNFAADVLVPLETVQAPSGVDSGTTTNLENKTVTDINDTALYMRLYVAAVSAADLADATADSQALASDSKAVAADLRLFSGGTYVYTTSGWVLSDAKGDTVQASSPPPSGQQGDMGLAPSNFPTPLLIPAGGSVNLGTNAIGKLDVEQGPWVLNVGADIDALTSSSSTITLNGNTTINQLTIGAETLTVGSGASVAVTNLTMPVLGTIDVAGTLTFAGNIIADLTNLPPNIELKGSGSQVEFDGSVDVVIDFTDQNQTVVQKSPPAGAIDTFRISGFVAGDTIDCPGIGSCTMSNPDVRLAGMTTAGNEVDLWSQAGNLVAQFTFTQGAPVSLVPYLDAKGGTQLIIAPNDPDATNPTNPPNKIDWDFVRDTGEGGTWLTPYVPQSGTSGVTIGAGVDLGSGPVTKTKFASIFQDYQKNPNLLFLYNVIGINNVEDATAYLGSNTETSGLSIFTNTVDITEPEADQLTGVAEQSTLSTLSSRWGDDPSFFNNEPEQVQTVLFDIAYNNGVGGVPTELWNDLFDNQWGAAYQYLQNWSARLQGSGDNVGAQRRASEAAHLQSLATNPPSVTPIQGTPVSGAEIYRSVSVAANTPYKVDPTGSDVYTLTAIAGSPGFATLSLPELAGVVSYNLSFENGSSWTAAQNVLPDQYLTLPAGTDGMSVETLDGNSQPVTSADPIAFNVTFAADGLFSGTLTSTTPVPCFATGTRIATTRGAIAVDDLAVGDLLVLAHGRIGPIVWIGHRQVDCRLHSRPFDLWPIRVAAGSLAPASPNRDLFLSPDHAVFVDGVLIPIRYLINGSTIIQEQVDEVTYYHVELDRHAVLLAEGLPCESYLDTGNRSAFADPTTDLIDGGKSVGTALAGVA